MTDDGDRLPWTDEQWATVQRTAVEAARRARTASTFLPLVGPLPEGQASVPKLTMEQKAPDVSHYGTGRDRLEIDDGETMKLVTLSSEIFVRTQQAHDPDLSSVLQMVSRAAVVIGRLEDAIVLLGQPGADKAPQIPGGAGVAVTPNIYRVQGGGEHLGLRQVKDSLVTPDAGAAGLSAGERLVKVVVKAIDALERRGQYGPFGAMFGHDLYETAHEPSPGSLVLPADRFVPFLAGGPLLRSSVLPPGEGVIVATAGAPIDLVVASDIHVSYLQRTTEPRYVLRVSERIALRLKQSGAVGRVMLQEPPPPANKASKSIPA